MIRRRERSRGQGLVEFALVLPVFLLMMFGLIDVGRFVYQSSTLSQAAREGARLGSVEASYKHDATKPDDPACGAVGGPVCPADDVALLADVRGAANRMMSPFGAVSNTYMSCVLAPPTGTPPTGTWTGGACSENGPGNIISVRVTAEFTPITPIISNLFGTRTLSGSAAMTIN